MNCSAEVKSVHLIQPVPSANLRYQVSIGTDGAFHGTLPRNRGLELRTIKGSRLPSSESSPRLLSFLPSNNDLTEIKSQRKTTKYTYLKHTEVGELLG